MLILLRKNAGLCENFQYAVFGFASNWLLEHFLKSGDDSRFGHALVGIFPKFKKEPL